MNRYIIFLLICIFILLPGIRAENSIQLVLDYGKIQSIDQENDGKEPIGEYIDLSVSSSQFSWNPIQENLCTRWTISALDIGKVSQYCKGGTRCCNFIGLEKDSSYWDDPLLVSYGGKVGKDNNISAKIYYVDFSLDPDMPYSDIFNSSSDYLYAGFTGRRIQSPGSPILTVYSPQNYSTNGERIYLNFSLDEEVLTTVEFDNQTLLLGQGATFSHLLNGSLPFGVIKNGIHNITIEVLDNSSAVHIYELSFLVNDTSPPQAKFSILNSSLNNTIINAPDLLGTIDIVTDELTILDISINNAYFNTTLIEGKAAMNTLFTSGNNFITASLQDLQGNSRTIGFDFEYLLPYSCSDGIKNGDEQGIDCGGSCSACVPFSISLPKTEFTTAEPIKLTVASRPNSTINLSVYRNSIKVFTDTLNVFTTMPGLQSHTTTLSNVSIPGFYSIVATSDYKGNIEPQYVPFTVIEANTLAVSLSANSTSVNENEKILFTPSVSGNSSTVSFSYLFGDGTASQEQSPVHSYSGNGTYKVNLTIKEGQWFRSTTREIDVYKVFNITIRVKNSTGALLKDTLVEFGNKKRNTSLAGTASFMVRKGDYNLIVSSPGYTAFSNSTEIGAARTIDIVLLKAEEDNTKPIVNIIGPANNKTILLDSAQISFSVVDQSKVNCTIYFNLEDDWWIEKEKIKEITDTSQQSVTVSGLDSGEYGWRIDCIDKFGNTGSSGIRLLSVNYSAETDAETEITENIDSTSIIARADAALEYVRQSGSVEREVADALQLEKALDDLKKEAARANRDIYNLKWRKLNKTERDAIEKEIKDKIALMEKNTPRSFQVRLSKEFVEYPTEEEISTVIDELMKLEKKDMDEKQRNKLVAYIASLQKSLTITTKYKIVDVTYISGDEGTITLIERSIQLQDESEEAKLVEYIPKALASDISEVNAKFEFDVLKQDPMIGINPNIGSYVYYFQKEISVDDAKKIITIYYDDAIKSANLATGFTVFGSGLESPLNSADSRLLLEILIMILLVAIYLSLGHDMTTLRLLLTDRKSFKKLNKIKRDVKSSRDKLEKKDYEGAKEIYKKIEISFRELPKEVRSNIFPKIKKLSDKLNLYHIQDLLKEADIFLKSMDKKNSALRYRRIMQLYKMIDPKFKSKVLERCKDLHSKISEIKG